MKKILSVLIIVLVFLPLSSVSAHRSGCHRWHSCPSDTGSYVCGDLGYSSGCPKAAAKQKPIAAVKKAAASAASEKTCNPNYSGCLKPGTIDYDCKGGSGNGPYYTGKVKVIGYDQYGLDRDKDGWGCE